MDFSAKLRQAVVDNGGQMAHNDLVDVLEGDERYVAKSRWFNSVKLAGLEHSLVRDKEAGTFDLVYRIPGGAE